MSRIVHALSLKQPWAALVVHGLKSIEVRRWPTQRRGLILIHAAKGVDERRAPWNLVTDQVEPTSELRGGIIGAVEIVDCVTYETKRAFASDRQEHLNLPDWFDGPPWYGFVLKHPRRLIYQPFRGWFKFFPVECRGRALRDSPVLRTCSKTGKV